MTYVLIREERYANGHVAYVTPLRSVALRSVALHTADIELARKFESIERAEYAARPNEYPVEISHLRIK